MKQVITLCILSTFLVPDLSVAQSSEKPLAVGIFIYEGVEILDFSGPSEVFASTSGFTPFLVALTAEPVTSQGFIKVTPQYSIDNCPPTDILVFPGGATNSLIENEKLIAWVKDRAGTNQFMMSVCTGAAVLSKAGLLDGKEATTFHGYLGELQRITPQCTVLADTRFVDNGQVITTAGVSAGIDGALHLVSKIKGEQVARATARYMEYDKWHPEEGKVIESAFVASVRTNGFHSAMKGMESQGEMPLMYYGELNNLALELLESKPGESAAIYEWLIETSTPSPAMYDGLGMAWQRMGKCAPASSADVFEHLERGDLAWAKEKYAEAKSIHPEWMLFTEEDVNMAAYHCLASERAKESVAIFKWNTELFPKSANAWDSLAESLEATGQDAEAIRASQHCLSLLPEQGTGHQELLRRLSKERIERLKVKQ